MKTMATSIKEFYGCIRKINNILNHDIDVKDPWQRLIFIAATLAGLKSGLSIDEEATCPDVRRAAVEVLNTAMKSGKISKENDACLKRLIKLYDEVELKDGGPHIISLPGHGCEG